MAKAPEERTKLTASGLTSLAVSLITTGAVVPIVALIYHLPGYTPDWIAIAVSLGCIALGVVLHLVGRAILSWSDE